MTQIKDNKIFEKTSFLSGNNTSFIGELYSKYLNNPETVPKSWRDFFNAFSTEKEIIKNEIQGPSWAPKKIYKRSITTKIKEAENKNVFSPVTTNQEKNVCLALDRQKWIEKGMKIRGQRQLWSDCGVSLTIKNVR